MDIQLSDHKINKSNISDNAEIASATRKAVEVLRDKMIFYDEIAQGLIVKIIKALKEESNPRGDLLADMYRRFEKAAEIAIKCADKLASYETPKLQSQEIKKSVTHRFVIRTPVPMPSSEDWVNKVKPEHDKQLELQAKEVHRLVSASKQSKTEILEELIDKDE